MGRTMRELEESVRYFRYCVEQAEKIAKNMEENLRCARSETCGALSILRVFRSQVLDYKMREKKLESDLEICHQLLLADKALLNNAVECLKTALRKVTQ